MRDAKANFSTTCRKCGHELPPRTETCPKCGTTVPVAEVDLDPWSQWSKADRTMKLQWIATVMAFWVSVGVFVIMFVIKQQLDLILASIVLGLMLLGLWLKTRYQLHQRKEPEHRPQDVRSD